MQSFSSVFSHPRLLLNAARKKQATKHEMNNGGLRALTKNNEVIGGISMMGTSLASDQARRASRSKTLAKQYFDLAGLPTPRWRSFAATAAQEAQEFAASLPSATVKPATGRAGEGISTGLTEAAAFGPAWTYAKDSRRTPLHASREILVEETAAGLDLRCYVVGEDMVAALVRLPAFAVGDGESTVQEITERASARCGQHANLQTFSELNTEEAEALELAPGRVPAEGELVNLSGSAHPEHGGWPVDVTDLLDPAVADVAVEAAWAVPGLSAGAVDMRVPDLSTAEGAVVLEISESADISLHHYPAFGAPRPVAEAIISQMLGRSRPTG